MRRESVDQKTGTQSSENAGPTSHRQRQRCGLDRDAVLRKHGRKIGDQAIFTEGRKHNDGRQNPERRSAECGRHGHAREQTLVFSLRYWPIAHKQRGQRHAKQCDAPKHQIRVAPAVMINHPLRQRRDHNGPDATTGKDHSDRKPAPALEPGKDRAGVSELRGPIGDKTKHEVRQVEPLDARPKPAQRRQREREDHDRWKNDPAWREAVKQDADSRRNDRDGDRSQGKGAGDSLALPAKGRMQRIEKQAEGVRHDGSEAHHDADESRRGYVPARVVD